MSASAPAGMERRRFLNPHPHAFKWWTEEGEVTHKPGQVVEVLIPADQPCPQLLTEVFPDPVKPAKAAPKEA